MSMLLRHLEELDEVRGELEQRGGDALHLRREIEVGLVGRDAAEDVAKHLGHLDVAAKEREVGMGGE